MNKTSMVVWAAAVVLVAGAAHAGMGKGEGKEQSGHGMKQGGMMSMEIHFQELDTDGNDLISWDEFHNRFTRTEKSVFDILDTDKDAGLNHDEWHAFKEMHKGMGSDVDKGTATGTPYHGTPLPDPAVFNAHFPDMDSDNSGLVSLAEFKAHFAQAPEVDAVFTAIDLDRDGNLDHDEWHEFKSAHGMKHKE